MGFTNASSNAFPPATLQPLYRIWRDWCIGDSLGYLNDNFLYLESLTIGASAQPGTIIQTVTKQVSATGDVAASIPIDNTIPQITEGYELLNASITPKYTNSKIIITCKPVAMDTLNSGSYLKGTTIAALFRNDQTNALFANQTGGAYSWNSPLVFQDIAGTTNSLTYSVRVGGESGTVKLGASYVNPATNRADYFFGTAGTISTLIIQEIKG